MLGWTSGRTRGAWILGFFCSCTGKREDKGLGEGQPPSPPAVGLLSESGKLMMARGPVPGSEFLQVDFNKDKSTYKKQKIQRDRHKLKTRSWCSHHHSGVELKIHKNKKTDIDSKSEAARQQTDTNLEGSGR